MTVGVVIFVVPMDIEDVFGGESIIVEGDHVLRVLAPVFAG